MAKSGMELDFFNMAESSRTPTFDRKRSFCDIQGLISKINPEILKSVIARGGVDSKKSSLSTVSPKEARRRVVPSVPVCDPTLRLSNCCGGNAETAPMTIFYNGKVTVFDVPPHKARDILKLAAEEDGLPKSAESKQTAQYLLHALNGDLPIARRKSLQTFLEKRKQRLIMESPYLWSTTDAGSRKSVSEKGD